VVHLANYKSPSLKLSSDKLKGIGIKLLTRFSIIYFKKNGIGNKLYFNKNGYGTKFIEKLRVKIDQNYSKIIPDPIKSSFWGG
jgi:hypothetical protein